MEEQQEKPLAFSRYRSTDAYDSSSIRVLSGVSGIRKRPAMYIGSVESRGFHHLVYEVIDNCVDEALAGHADICEVSLLPNDYICVVDNGRGIPVDLHPQYKKSAVEVILTNLHAGGKFDNKAYKVSGGLHGIGLTAVNALSEDFHVQIKKNNLWYEQNYRLGEPIDSLKELSNTSLQLFTSTDLPEGESGTKITFKPDSSIFNISTFDSLILTNRLRDLSYLTPSMKFILNDLREEKPKRRVFESKDGLLSFIHHLLKIKDVSILEGGPELIFQTSTTLNEIKIELAMVWGDSYSETILGFANNINTQEGGNHISGFKTAITRTLNRFGREIGILGEKRENLQGNYLRQGLIAIINVKLPNPQFEGQTKTKLVNSDIDPIVNDLVGFQFGHWLQTHKQLGRAIIEKGLKEREIQNMLKKKLALSRKQVGVRSSLPGKLIASRERDPMKRELFLVEGQSAGGTAVKARDSQFQEILFLRGKVLNVEKSPPVRALENQEIQSIITAIGAGVSGIVDDKERSEEDDGFDISQCRYGKVIILTDADVDGAHIATLLLTLFFRYMRPLLENNRVFIAKPPLFQVKLSKKKRSDDIKKIMNNKLYAYFHIESEKDNFIAELVESGVPSKDITTQRYKGLGEMNADQLEETAMDVSSRHLEQLSIDDVSEAEEVFSILMGSDSNVRREFLTGEIFVSDSSSNSESNPQDNNFTGLIDSELLDYSKY